MIFTFEILKSPQTKVIYTSLLPLLKNFCFPSYCTEFSKGIRKSVASQVLFLLNLPLKLKHFELKLEITDNVYQGVFGLSYFFFDGHMF